MSAVKRNDIVQLLISMAILVIAGVLASLTYTKFDLTSEKRHTLTDATNSLLDSVPEPLHVRCYMTGDFPAKYKRLERSLREKLDEFSDRSDGMLTYEFIDPYESGDEETIAQFEERLYKSGLQFTRIAFEENGVQSFRLLWPAALITYKGKEVPVQFLKSDNPEMPDAMINTSINNIEYELASRIRMIMRDKKPAVAFVEGHGELEEIDTRDFADALREFYSVDRVKIDGKVNALCDKVNGIKYRIPKYDAIIVAKPDSVFSDRDKYVLDQYVMNGGKIIWLIDPILTDLDSLRTNQQTIGITNEMGLYDLLFGYGVRLNRNIVIDRSCALIDFDLGPMGNQRNIQLFNWYFSPVVIPPDTAHPIVSNLDPLFMEFASSLDTVGENKAVKKTVLLTSSYYSREFKAPVRINSGIVNIDPNFKEFNLPFQKMGVLLEGEFTSAFKDRLPDSLLRNPELGYRDLSRKTSMIVISDGDIIRNKVVESQDGKSIRPLGFDRYAGRVIYDNKEFLLNCVNYMLDDAALISLRSRTIELRKLDGERIIHEKSRWQAINMILPLMIVAIFGFALSWIRKKHYSVPRV
jgi:ABC-2 type transport system permease protein